MHYAAMLGYPVTLALVTASCCQEEYGPDLLATSAYMSACRKQGAWQSALDVFWRSSRARVQHNQISGQP